jgi:hypothetical protein
MSRRFRQGITGLAAVTLAVTGLTASLLSSGGKPPATTGDAELPTGLAAHMAQLKQSVPGNQGMSPEGPWSSADAEFDMRAYPADTISVQKQDAARQSWSRALSRRFGFPNKWQPVGPSEALYPASEFRDSSGYVPNEYVAGGRTTDAAIAKRCVPGDCRMWITPAGGGVWRTNDALAIPVRWKYLGGPLGINAAGTVRIDPHNPNTIWVGTGEANVCGAGCVAGVGLYKSTNGGNTWTGPIGKATLGGKGVAEIVIDPRNRNIVYAATTTALRGHSSVCCGGITRPVPGAQKWGLYKSVDGGRNWAFIHNGTADASQCTGTTAEFNNLEACSPRGVRNFELDPNNANILYASSYARGVWRSNDAGATWTQIKPSLARDVITTRPTFDAVALPNGKTRMYVYEGNTGTPYSRLFRSDDVATGTPTFTDLTSNNPADPGYGTYNNCTGQCWYDQFVMSPDGHPDMVYVGGSYVYGEQFSNKRGVVLSKDAGVTSHDMTMDGTDPVHPNGLHPDQHSLVVHPNNPEIFFETNDGGVMRSNGRFVNRSSWCADRPGITDVQRARCEQLLSRIPEKLIGMNNGLSTLQFQSLSVSPHNSRLLQGGTQDNGTWENKGQTTRWVNTMIGDGGQSGFDVARPEFRFHNFFDASTEVNFDNGDTADWIWTADPIYGLGSQFYPPVISDPVVSGTLFAGTARTVHRTKTFGLGNRTLAEANRICNTWTGTFEAVCGDWEETGPNRLTSDFFGDRAGGSVVAVERSKADRSTAWAATNTGRLFISRNIDAEPASAVTWTRVDDDVTIDPNRFVSSIYPDRWNRNKAYVSYSGYNATTPDTPGHVFEITFNPATGTAAWRDISYDFSDLPITDLVRDDLRGDLYASTDFGVLRLPLGSRSWRLAAPGMPNVEVAGLTIVGRDRVLYAASHGLSAWRLRLP